MDTKDTIVNAFFTIKSFHDTQETNNFIKRIEKYNTEHNEPDYELKYLAIAIQASLEDCISGNFVECRNIALPVFSWLKGEKDWSFLSMVILSMVVAYTESYKESHLYAQEAVSKLRNNYAHEKRHIPTIYSIYGRLTMRLLRARYFEISIPVKQKDELQEINNLFDYYLKLSKKACEERNYHAYGLVLDVRKALFDEDCEAITKILDGLEKSGNRDWLKTARDEVIEYLSYLNDRLTTPLRRLLIGRRIQTRREAIEMTVKELAEQLNTDPIVVNEFERGDSGVSLARLRKIAQILNVDMAYLSGDDAKPKDTEGDIILHELTKILKKATKEEKQYLLNQAKAFMKLRKNSHSGE